MKEYLDVRRLRALFDLVRKDTIYSEMSKQYQKLESDFERIMQRLPSEEEDLAWEFVCLSDDINLRIIEILCEKFEIDFLEIEKGQ